MTETAKSQINSNKILDIRSHGTSGYLTIKKPSYPEMNGQLGWTE